MVFLAALALYAATANRWPQWQDSGSHILRVVTGELANPRGLALAHPLHHWLGRFIVFLDLLEPCFAMTLISALAAALTVALAYACVLTLTRARVAALLAAASLALAHTFWQLATRTETYTLATALFAGECLCLAAYAVRARPGCLWLMLLFNGLGIANHMLASLTTPILAFVVLHAVRKGNATIKDAGIAVGLWLLGSLPYSALVITELARTGDLPGTLHSAFFGYSFADEVLNLKLSGRMLLVGAAFVALNFPNLLLPAATYGFIRAGRVGVPKLARRALLVELVVHACFAGRYSVVDQYMFFLPSYLLLSVFGGIGFALMLRWGNARSRRVGLAAVLAGLVLTTVVYAAVPAAARKFNVLGSVARNKPYRDDYVYIFTPWSVTERSAERMSRHAVELAGPFGLILSEDPASEFALRYQAFRAGLNQPVVTRRLTEKSAAGALEADRPVVLVPANADAPKTDPPVGSWKRVDDLYILVPEPAKR